MICIFSLSVMFVAYFNPFAPERPVTAHADPRPFYPLLSAHAELRKLIFCIWIRRPRSVQPVNRFVVSFSSL